MSTRHFNTNVLDFSISTDTNSSRPPVLLFGDFVNPVSRKNRIYEEIIDIDKLKTALVEYLTDFNIAYNKDMHIIFFMDAIEHITRIARILRSERGNALLVGVNGMGKQSLTKLSSHINTYKYVYGTITFCWYKHKDTNTIDQIKLQFTYISIFRCFQIKLTKSYNHTTFRKDLANLYFNTGVQFEETTFLLADNQIIQEEFLEDVSNILSSGKSMYGTIMTLKLIM